MQKLKRAIITTTCIGIIIPILTGCAALGPAALAGAGGAGGALAGKSLGDGSIGPIILGGALGAGIATAIGIEMEKKAAREKAQAFEEGRRYEREVQAQEHWYQATLEPDDPSLLFNNNRPTSRTLPANAPATTTGGMRLNERTVREQVMP